MMPRVAVASLLLLVVVARAHAGAAGDGTERARALFDRAADEYRARAFGDAAADLEGAYALDPRPEYLFAWAQAERLRGDCARAVALYDRLSARLPPGGDRDAALSSRALCPSPAPVDSAAPSPAARSPAARSPAAPSLAVPPLVVPAAAASARSAAPSDHPRWYRDPIGGVLCGVGVALVAVGVGFAGRYGADVAAMHRAPDYGSFDDGFGSATRDGAIALTGAIAGAALVVGGALRYHAYAHRRTSSP